MRTQLTIAKIQRFAVEAGQDTSPQPDFVMLKYLAAHGAGPERRPDLLADLQRENALNVAKACYAFRNHAPAVAEVLTPLHLDRSREICGLFGSVAESLCVAAAAEVEIEWHDRAQETGSLPPAVLQAGSLPPAMLAGQRFFLVAQANDLVGVGHRLVNVVARTLGLHSGIETAMAGRNSHVGELGSRMSRYSSYMKTRRPDSVPPDDTFRPFSSHKADWLSCNAPTAKQLKRAVTNAAVPEAADLIKPLVRLCSSGKWTDLVDLRGEEHHRWRRESSMAAGIDETSGPSSDVTDFRGHVVGKSMGTNPVPYSAADGRNSEMNLTTRNGLRQLASSTNEVLAAMRTAIGPLTDGRLTCVNDQLVVNVF